jgi:hypothetical protein
MVVIIIDMLHAVGNKDELSSYLYVLILYLNQYQQRASCETAPEFGKNKIPKSLQAKQHLLDIL